MSWVEGVIVGAISVVSTVGATAAYVSGLKERVSALERSREAMGDKFVPRSECELALNNIEKNVDQLSRLLTAFIYSGGDHGLAIKAIEAGADVPEYVDDYVANDCRRFEGSTAWMILDSVGLVTVAVGNMLPDVAAACRLPFRDATGALATPQAIAADFARVAAMTPDRLPRFYVCASSLTLLPADISGLLRQRCIGFDAQLNATFPWFAHMPDIVKKAVLDMAFNLGVGRPHPPTGLHDYTHMLADLGCTPPNFAGAALTCGRDVHISAFDVRNAWTVSLFNQAAKGVTS